MHDARARSPGRRRRGEREPSREQRDYLAMMQYQQQQQQQQQFQQQQHEAMLAAQAQQRQQQLPPASQPSPPSLQQQQLPQQPLQQHQYPQYPPSQQQSPSFSMYQHPNQYPQYQPYPQPYPQPYSQPYPQAGTPQQQYPYPYALQQPAYLPHPVPPMSGYGNGTPSQQSQRPPSVYSSDSGDSSSILDISRFVDTNKYGGFFSAFVKAPSERARQKRKQKKQRKRRILYFGNSSSSSVNSDMAYGNGYVKYVKSSTSKSGTSSPYSKTTVSNPPRSDGTARPPSPRKERTDDEEIIAIGRQLSDLARKQNEKGIGAAGKPKPTMLMVGAATLGHFHSQRKKQKEKKIKKSSRYHNSSSDDESDWESASEDEDDSSLSDDAPSELAYGVGPRRPIEPATGVFGAAATPPVASYVDSERQHGHRRKSSVVDPRLFGPVNSLRGMINTPCGFDGGEEDKRSQHSDPNSFKPQHHARPADVPIQQPIPHVPVSSKVYEPENFDHGDYRRGENGWRWGHSGDSSGAVAGAAAAMAAAAMSARKAGPVEEKSEEPHPREEHLPNREERLENSDRPDRDSKRRDNDSDGEERPEQTDKRDKRDREPKYRDHESDRKKEKAKDRREAKRESKREVKRSDVKNVGQPSKPEDRARESTDEAAPVELPAEKSHKRQGEEIQVEFDSDSQDDAPHAPRDHGQKYDPRDERRELHPSSQAGFEATPGPQPKVSGTPVDPFQFQVDNDAFPTPQTQTPRPLTPTVVTVDREPRFDDSPPRNRAADARLSRRDSFEIEKMVEEYNQRQAENRNWHDQQRTDPRTRPIYDEVEHATVPLAAAAVASAIAAEEHAARDRRRRDDSDEESHERPKAPNDPVQEEADRHYREATARRIAEEERSRSTTPERSVVDKYANDDEQPGPIIVAPPVTEDKHEKGPFDAPDADVRIDNKIFPQEEDRFRKEPGTALARDPSAERNRPVLNLVYPTPVASRQPTPSQEHPAEESQKPEETAQTEPTSDDVVISPKGNVVEAPPHLAKSVSWGQNETKTFENESPENRSDSDSIPSDSKKPTKTDDSTSKWGMGMVAAALAGIGTTPDEKPAVRVREISKEPETRSEEPEPSKWDSSYRNASGEIFSLYPDETPPVPGPKPSSPVIDPRTGMYAEDLEFAATLAAGLKDSGFDDKIVLNNPAFGRRSSPPGSQDASGDSFQPPSSKFGYRGRPSSGSGFVMGEVSTPQEEEIARGQGLGDVAPLSKKDKKKLRRKASDGGSVIDAPVDTDSTVSSRSSKNERRKRQKDSRSSDESLAKSPDTANKKGREATIENLWEKSPPTKSKYYPNAEASVDEIPEQTLDDNVRPKKDNSTEEQDESLKDRQSRRSLDQGGGRSSSISASGRGYESDDDQSKRSRGAKRHNSDGPGEPFSLTPFLRERESWEDFNVSTVGPMSYLDDEPEEPEEPEVRPDSSVVSSRRKPLTSGEKETKETRESRLPMAKEPSSNSLRRRDSEKKSGTGNLFSGMFKSKEKDKEKDKSNAKQQSFLGNADTLGEGVGLASAAFALVALTRPNATNAPSELEQANYNVSRDMCDYTFDQEITPRRIKPAIDPQYGDLLPLPPSEPGTPEEPPQNLPFLPESRPNTPPAEERARDRELYQHHRRHSSLNAPVKSPSQTAIPIQLRLGQRSPSSPTSNTGTSSATPVSPETRRVNRPTSWESSREFRPLYLVEHARRNSNTEPAAGEEDLPELPPSESPSRGESPGPTHDRGFDQFRPPLEDVEIADHPLRINTNLPPVVPRTDEAESEETTPRAETKPELPLHTPGAWYSEESLDDLTSADEHFSDAREILSEAQTPDQHPYDASPQTPTYSEMSGGELGSAFEYEPAPVTPIAERAASPAMPRGFHPTVEDVPESASESQTSSSDHGVMEPASDFYWEPANEQVHRQLPERSEEPAIEPVGESIDISFSSYVPKSVPEPVEEIVVSRPRKRVPKPTVEDVPEPARELVSPYSNCWTTNQEVDLFWEPASETAHQPVMEGLVEPVIEPVDYSLEDSSFRSASKLAPEPVEELVIARPRKRAPKPTVEDISEPSDETSFALSTMISGTASGPCWDPAEEATLRLPLPESLVDLVILPVEEFVDAPLFDSAPKSYTEPIEEIAVRRPAKRAPKPTVEDAYEPVDERPFASGTPMVENAPDLFWEPMENTTPESATEPEVDPLIMPINKYPDESFFPSPASFLPEPIEEIVMRRPAKRAPKPTIEDISEPFHEPTILSNPQEIGSLEPFWEPTEEPVPRSVVEGPTDLIIEPIDISLQELPFDGAFNSLPEPIEEIVIRRPAKRAPKPTIEDVSESPYSSVIASSSREVGSASELYWEPIEEPVSGSVAEQAIDPLIEPVEASSLESLSEAVANFPSEPVEEIIIHRPVKRAPKLTIEDAPEPIPQPRIDALVDWPLGLTDEDDDKLISGSIDEPMIELVLEPTVDPSIERLLGHDSGLYEEPIDEIVIRPTRKQVLKATVEDTLEDILEPEIEPLGEFVIEPITSPINENFTERSLGLIDDPVIEPIFDGTTESTRETAPPFIPKPIKEIVVSKPIVPIRYRSLRSMVEDAPEPVFEPKSGPFEDWELESADEMPEELAEDPIIEPINDFTGDRSTASLVTLAPEPIETLVVSAPTYVFNPVLETKPTAFDQPSVEPTREVSLEPSAEKKMSPASQADTEPAFDEDVEFAGMTSKDRKKAKRARRKALEAAKKLADGEQSHEAAVTPGSVLEAPCEQEQQDADHGIDALDEGSRALDDFEEDLDISGRPKEPASIPEQGAPAHDTREPDIEELVTDESAIADQSHSKEEVDDVNLQPETRPAIEDETSTIAQEGELAIAQNFEAPAASVIYREDDAKLAQERSASRSPSPAPEGPASQNLAPQRPTTLQRKVTPNGGYFLAWRRFSTLRNALGYRETPSVEQPIDDLDDDDDAPSRSQDVPSSEPLFSQDDVPFEDTQPMSSSEPTQLEEYFSSAEDIQDEMQTEPTLEDAAPDAWMDLAPVTEAIGIAHEDAHSETPVATPAEMDMPSAETPTPEKGGSRSKQEELHSEDPSSTAVESKPDEAASQGLPRFEAERDELKPDGTVSEVKFEESKLPKKLVSEDSVFSQSTEESAREAFRDGQEVASSDSPWLDMNTGHEETQLERTRTAANVIDGSSDKGLYEKSVSTSEIEAVKVPAEESENDFNREQEKIEIEKLSETSLGTETLPEAPVEAPFGDDTRAEVPGEESFNGELEVFPAKRGTDEPAEATKEIAVTDASEPEPFLDARTTNQADSEELTTKPLPDLVQEEPGSMLEDAQTERLIAEERIDSRPDATVEPVASQFAPGMKPETAVEAAVDHSVAHSLASPSHQCEWDLPAKEAVEADSKDSPQYESTSEKQPSAQEPEALSKKQRQKSLWVETSTGDIPTVAAQSSIDTTPGPSNESVVEPAVESIQETVEEVTKTSSQLESHIPTEPEKPMESGASRDAPPTLDNEVPAEWQHAQSERAVDDVDEQDLPKDSAIDIPGDVFQREKAGSQSIRSIDVGFITRPAGKSEDEIEVTSKSVQGDNGSMTTQVPDSGETPVAPETQDTPINKNVEVSTKPQLPTEPAAPATEEMEPQSRKMSKKERRREKQRKKAALKEAMTSSNSQAAYNHVGGSNPLTSTMDENTSDEAKFQESDLPQEHELVLPLELGQQLLSSELETGPEREPVQQDESQSQNPQPSMNDREVDKGHTDATRGVSPEPETSLVASPELVPESTPQVEKEEDKFTSPKRKEEEQRTTDGTTRRAGTEAPSTLSPEAAPEPRTNDETSVLPEDLPKLTGATEHSDMPTTDSGVILHPEATSDDGNDHSAVKQTRASLYPLEIPGVFPSFEPEQEHRRPHGNQSTEFKDEKPLETTSSPKVADNADVLELNVGLARSQRQSEPSEHDGETSRPQTLNNAGLARAPNAQFESLLSGAGPVVEHPSEAGEDDHAGAQIILSDAPQISNQGKELTYALTELHGRSSAKDQSIYPDISSLGEPQKSREPQSFPESTPSGSGDVPQSEPFSDPEAMAKRSKKDKKKSNQPPPVGFVSGIGSPAREVTPVLEAETRTYGELRPIDRRLSFDIITPEPTPEPVVEFTGRLVDTPSPQAPSRRELRQRSRLGTQPRSAPVASKTQEGSRSVGFSRSGPRADELAYIEDWITSSPRPAPSLPAEEVGGKKRRGNGKQRIVDRRQPQEGDIFDDEALWESVDKKAMEEADTSQALDPDNSLHERKILDARIDDDFWGNRDAADDEALETPRDAITQLEDDFMGGNDGPDEESKEVYMKTEENAPLAEAITQSMETTDVAESVKKGEPAVKPKDNSEQPARPAAQLNDDFEESPVLGRPDSQLSQLERIGLLRRNSGVGEPTGGLLKENNQTTTLLGDSPMKHGGVRRSTSLGMFLPPVQEIPEAEAEPSKDSLVAPQADINRDSGFSAGSPELPAQHSINDEAQRDSGVHTSDWEDSAQRIKTPEPPQELMRLIRKSPRMSQMLQHPGSRQGTPRPEKARKQYGALTPSPGPEAGSGSRSLSDSPMRYSASPQARARRSLSSLSHFRPRTPEPLNLVLEQASGTDKESGTLRRVADKRVNNDLRDASQQQQQNSTPVANEGRVRTKDMTDILYDGFGEGRIGSPRSPTRPHSMRRRQSMQVIELESRVEQLLAENNLLSEARAMAESGLGHRAASSLAEREAEIDNLKQSLQFLQKEVTRLSEVNDGLTSANAELASKDTGRYGELETRHATVVRELGELRDTQESFDQTIQEKDAEIASLRQQLDEAQEKIREMQAQILESKASDEHFLNIRDEDYFDHRCQILCSHIQQWVLRFSKFSDMRACRLTSELNDEKTIDRLDNAVLDGSDVDRYLKDRIKRRDIFMSMTMNMVWEFVFTRYLFGMDREQRQKLKSLEKLLTEVGPPEAVRSWRAVTLTLLSKRDGFKRQRDLDTEAVVQAVYQTLCKILPPPSNLEEQIQAQLRRVMRAAVELSIEMRTQKAEYMMLPPLQPEYDADGELAATVQFNAQMMSERSGKTSLSAEELEAEEAIVRVVLFPLVVKKGDDNGFGDDEVVVCPAQVLVNMPRSMMNPTPSSDGGDGRSYVSAFAQSELGI